MARIACSPRGRTLMLVLAVRGKLLNSGVRWEMSDGWLINNEPGFSNTIRVRQKHLVVDGSTIPLYWISCVLLGRAFRTRLAVEALKKIGG